MREARAATPAEGGMVLGRWRLGRVLGRGGMGFVYEGVDPDSRRAAVKVLDRYMAVREDHFSRFRRESKILERFRHPNVVALVEHGEEAGVPYLVTELVLGPGRRPVTLDWLLAEDRTPLSTCLDLFEEALEGLDHVHRLGVVHRDFKPTNVLVEQTGPGPILRARLTDFGIARVLGESTDSRSEVAGTARYMAPELRSRPDGLDVRSDIYSAGVFLAEILDGAGSSSGAHGGSEALRAIARRATAADPDERYPDPLAFASEVALARLDTVDQLDPTTRRWIGILHFARSVELDSEGDRTKALRHHKVSRRLLTAGKRIPHGLVGTLRALTLAGALAALVAFAGSWLSVVQESWRSEGWTARGERHLDLGERKAAERALAASSDLAASRVLDRLLAEDREEAAVLGRYRHSIELALARAEFERALDLVEAVPGDLARAADHDQDAGAGGDLQGSIDRAKRLLGLGDRIGARAILVEASRVLESTRLRKGPAADTGE